MGIVQDRDVMKLKNTKNHYEARVMIQAYAVSEENKETEQQSSEASWCEGLMLHVHDCRDVGSRQAAFSASHLASIQ